MGKYYIVTLGLVANSRIYMQMATNFGASLVVKVYFGIYLINQDLQAPLVCEHLGFSVICQHCDVHSN